MRPSCSVATPIVVGALKHEQLWPALWRVWQLPGVVVTDVDIVVVCDPPAGVGVVTLVLEDEVVVGGAPGVGAGVVTVSVVDEVVVAGGVVVCASDIGMANARLTHSAPAASNAFMGRAPGPQTGPGQ
jgi:hypothetical protein